MAHSDQPNLNLGFNIKPPKPLVVDKTGNNWRLWRQQYEWFETANQMQAKPADVQVATFMLSIGTEAQVIYNTWNVELTNVAALKEHFQNYFCEPDKNVAALNVEQLQTKVCGPDIQGQSDETRKLPILKAFELELPLIREEIRQLSDLRAVYIHCIGEKIKYSHMKKLSENIKDLRIRNGDFNDNVKPLKFNNLRHLTCRAHTEHGLWKYLTKSQMPTLQSLEYSNDDFQFTEEDHQAPLLKFIESKTSLESVFLINFFECLPFGFFQQIIGILEKTCTPKRPVLNLNIFPFEFSDEVVS